MDALERAGIRTGDILYAEVRGPGEVLLVRHVDPVTQYAGALTGVYGAGELEELRRVRSENDLGLVPANLSRGHPPEYRHELT